jgi:glycosyltransferase 2 family protein
MMRGATARSAIVIGSLVVSALFGYLAVRDVQWAATWSALRRNNYWWLVPTGVAFAVSVVLRAVRWRALFRPEERPGFGPVMKAMLVGLLFNIVLPVRAGEAVRIVALRGYAGTPMAEATTTVVVERLLDVLSLLGLLFLLVPWLPHVTWLRAAVVAFLVAATITAILVAAVRHTGRRPAVSFTSLLSRLPFITPASAQRLATSVAHGLSAFGRPRQAAAALGWTVLSWLVLGLAFWFLLVGFSLHLPLLAGMLIAIATGLSFVIPAAPGGVGVFEAAGLAATGAYGVSQSRALAYVLVLHAVNVVPFMIAGLVVLATGRRIGRDV